MFDNIIKELEHLINLSKDPERGGDYAKIVWEANVIKRQVTQSLIIPSLILLVAGLINVAGHGYLNFWMALILQIPMWHIALNADLIVKLGIVGALLGGKDNRLKEATAVSATAFKAVVGLILYFTTALMLLSVFPIERFFTVVPVVILTFLMFSYIAIYYGRVIRFTEPFVCWFTFAILIGSAGLLAHPVFWKKFPATGWLVSWVPTRLEMTLDDVKTAREKKAEEDQIDFVKRVQKEYVQGGVDGIKDKADRERWLQIEKDDVNGKPLKVLGDGISSFVNSLKPDPKFEIVTKYRTRPGYPIPFIGIGMGSRDWIRDDMIKFGTDVPFGYKIIIRGQRFKFKNGGWKIYYGKVSKISQNTDNSIVGVMAPKGEKITIEILEPYTVQVKK